MSILTWRARTKHLGPIQPQSVRKPHRSYSFAPSPALPIAQKRTLARPNNAKNRAYQLSHVGSALVRLVRIVYGLTESCIQPASHIFRTPFTSCLHPVLPPSKSAPRPQLKTTRNLHLLLSHRRASAASTASASAKDAACTIASSPSNGPDSSARACRAAGPGATTATATAAAAAAAAEASAAAAGSALPPPP